ncbi:MAG: hypothetical protein Q9M17_03265 [Mariprofundus sp.]|nr:hypothetical protein [Mariprofundus sp.]
MAVTAQRECNNGHKREETRYFISSLDATDRARKGNSAANMAVVRHIALNLIKADTSSKIGIKNRRLKAGWDNDYLEKLLMGK